ncbi:MAG: cytochrome c [Phaeodactylibacter sp.]|nr:cytochrome c [Phaeodactylibacter sp.]
MDGSSYAALAYDEGKAIFANYCAACHNKNMRDHLTGPALYDVEKRWAAYPREDLHKWIRNSQALVEAGHPRALELWADWQPTIMTSFETMDSSSIEAVLAYIEHSGPVY